GTGAGSSAGFPPRRYGNHRGLHRSDGRRGQPLADGTCAGPRGIAAAGAGELRLANPVAAPVAAAARLPRADAVPAVETLLRAPGLPPHELLRLPRAARPALPGAIAGRATLALARCPGRQRGGAGTGRPVRL